MSDFRGIGGVSETMKDLLEDRMELPPGLPQNIKEVRVTVGVPHEDEKEKGHGVEEPRVNLFLYRVTENGCLKNQEIPGTGHPGDYGHPPLSLNLHYLLTPYGTTADEPFLDETLAHYLLGSAMRVLHDNPVITEALKSKKKKPGETILHESLRNEFEKVKLCLEPISLEDLSKVWTALTLPYRLSAAYIVSVVQIESSRAKHLSLPVLDLPRDKAPRIYIVPFKHPKIKEVSPVQAQIGEDLIILGENLASALQVKIGRLTLPVTPSPNGSIKLNIPKDKYYDGTPIDEKNMLRAGIQTVQVVTSIPTLPKKYFYSNLAVFMLVPKIKSVNPASGKAGDNITAEFTPQFCRGDRAQLFVGDHGLEPQPLSSGVKNSYKLDFKLPTDYDEKIPSRPTKPYPLRLRINGAESKYELVGDPPTPKWTFEVK